VSLLRSFRRPTARFLLLAVYGAAAHRSLERDATTFYRWLGGGWTPPLVSDLLRTSGLGPACIREIQYDCTGYVHCVAAICDPVSVQQADPANRRRGGRSPKPSSRAADWRAHSVLTQPCAPPPPAIRPATD
jgi:hypothetical protein